MLILLVVIIMIASILILAMKRNKESLYLFFICVSLLLEFTGILIFIAKKGGYSKEILEFLFINIGIKTRIQYLFITLENIGYILAIGRYLFPMFMLLMAIHYSYLPYISNNLRLKRLITILPIVSLIVYFPPIYNGYIIDNLNFQRFVVDFSYAWIMIYVIISMVLFIIEYYSITMNFCRKQFSMIVMCMLSLSGLYALYCGQDPGQVYRFYDYNYTWSKGLGYLQYALSVKGYYVLVLINIICGFLGFLSMYKYTRRKIETDREELVMERKFDTARVGASIFVHSMKNQLLSQKVLFKRIGQLYDSKEPDIERLKDYVYQLEMLNINLIERMEDLYRSVKANSITLIPIAVIDICESAVDRFNQKYADIKIDIKHECNAIVLADRMHMSEVIYNILINAQDSVIDANRGDKGNVLITTHNERLYTVIEIRDNGCGIPKNKIKKIFEPFYSSKNSNHNWGMGLYYVRAIVKSHYGSVRIESIEGEGTSFFVILPKYRERLNNESY